MEWCSNLGSPFPFRRGLQSALFPSYTQEKLFPMWLIEPSEKKSIVFENDLTSACASKYIWLHSTGLIDGVMAVHIELLYSHETAGHLSYPFDIPKD